MADQDQGREKRKHRRFFVENIDGTIVLASKVKILNLSIGGAAIEVNRRLERGRQYSLKIVDTHKTVAVAGKVMWAKLKKFGYDENGETQPIYEAGIKFTDILNDNAFGLLKFISSHKEERDKRLQGIRFTIKSNEPGILNYSLQYKVKKMSLGGMLIEANQQFKRNDTFQMELTLNDVPLMFTGRITSCFSSGAKTYDLGIAFKDVSKEHNKVLAQFIETLDEQNLEC